MNALSRKIRNARIAMDFSQAYVSKKLNVSQQTYSILENDPSKLSIERFVILCRILSLSASDVIEQIEMELEIAEQADPNDAATKERDLLNRQLQSMQLSLQRLKNKLDALKLDDK